MKTLIFCFKILVLYFFIPAIIFMFPIVLVIITGDKKYMWFLIPSIIISIIIAEKVLNKIDD